MIKSRIYKLKHIRRDKTEEKMKFSKRDKEMNRNVYAGLVGGLFVVWATLATGEIIRLLNLPNNFITNLLIPVPIAIILFIIFAVTLWLLEKGK